MMKALQKKFVFTAMIAVSILLFILLGIINIVNIAMVRTETDKTLTMISEADGNFDHIQPPPNSAPPFDFRIKPKDERDKFLSSNFFIVRLNGNGQIVFTDVSRTSLVDEASAEELALRVLDEGTSVGKAGKYRYQISNSHTGNETVIVFLDTSEEILSYVRVLFLSGGIGLSCWILMLFMVMFLSKKAIFPIVENMERQKQFVTNAGHEIKTPLAVILANTEAMELYNGENKWSKNIREQTVRLNGLMKNLLLLAKMDESAAEIIKTEISFSELVSENVRVFAEPLNLRSITLQTEIQPNVIIKANKEQISQLISILLDNASKYTNNRGTVIVRLQKSDKRIKLLIKNSCEKLLDTPPDKLFDRFYRDDKARTQKTGGYGIGLSVARSIVLANKGSITAEYENPNFVSFTVTL
ncbi:MAG: HAMP domain-containing histidine kinase [Lachnospiraceae bacterium]|jgi:two-component system sensor histidine kinase CiaH|nr:HAMP domain-containing histidine kinase [Lachnospiraceae bacterium]MCI9058400.1 HAMP domain-containing histidine kinase [Lachnospiraceae bacterium]